jgi:hypothetical protein
MELLGDKKPEPFDCELTTTDIGERLRPYLGKKARKLLNTGIGTHVIQFDRGADGKIYQLKPIWAQEPDDRLNQEYTREVHTVLSLSKLVKLKLDEPMPEEWIKRFALLIDKLAEAEKIKYGVLGPPVMLHLAIVEPKRRVMLIQYCFSDESLDQLNEWLQNEAFIEEGGLANDDWTNLPE